MKTAQNNLQKKLRSDTICNYVITALIGMISIINMADFFIVLDSVRIAGENYKGTDPRDILAEALLFAFLAAALLMLSLILGEISKTGRPFSKKNHKQT